MCVIFTNKQIQKIQGENLTIKKIEGKTTENFTKKGKKTKQKLRKRKSENFNKNGGKNKNSKKKVRKKDKNPNMVGKKQKTQKYFIIKNIFDFFRHCSVIFFRIV